MLCDICAKRTAVDTHHLCYNRANRVLSDEDNLTLKLCRDCHDAIHHNATTGKLSKMLGQAMWEKKYIVDEVGESHLEELARTDFRKRYGESFL